MTKYEMFQDAYAGLLKDGWEGECAIPEALKIVEVCYEPPTSTYTPEEPEKTVSPEKGSGNSEEKCLHRYSQSCDFCLDCREPKPESAKNCDCHWCNQ